MMYVFVYIVDTLAHYLFVPSPCLTDESQPVEFIDTRPPCGKRLAHAPGRFVGGRPGADGAKTPFELSTHFTHRCRSLILLLSSLLVVIVWFSLTIVFQSLADSLYCNVQTEKRIVCCENGNFPLDMDALCGMCRYSSTSIYTRTHLHTSIYTYSYLCTCYTYKFNGTLAPSFLLLFTELRHWRQISNTETFNSFFQKVLFLLFYYFNGG